MNDSTRQRIAIRASLIRRVKSDLIGRLSLPYRPDDLHEDVPLLGSGLGLDSLDALEVVLGIEQEFGVRVEEGNVSVLRSFNTIVDYLLAQGVTVAEAGGDA